MSVKVTCSTLPSGLVYLVPSRVARVVPDAAKLYVPRHLGAVGLLPAHYTVAQTKLYFLLVRHSSLGHGTRNAATFSRIFSTFIWKNLITETVF